MRHPFEIYSRQILSFRLDGLNHKEDFTPGDNAESTALKHLQFAGKRKAKSVVLFGITDAQLAKAFALNKPGDTELIICDLYPGHVRELSDNLEELYCSNTGCYLLTDSSIWSITLLLVQNGYKGKDCHLVLNPDLKGKAKTVHRNLQRLFSGIKEHPLPDTGNLPLISAGAILSPEEPDVEDYINSLPEWLHEIVIIWDCPENYSYPRLTHPRGVTIINKAHPLAADFGSQRNRMLEACTGEWVVYLDADERLEQENWEKLRKATLIKDCEGWYFPRLTFYPDPKHVRTGYGLWPDLQLRFFKNTGKLQFKNKIHEQLDGIIGNAGILPSIPIHHLTHLLKSREKIEGKLHAFNEASEGRYTHRLGEEFPYLERNILYPEHCSSLPALILPKFKLQ